VPGESGTREADEQQADLDRKIEEYTQAIALDPQDADAYYNRGLAYAHIGDPDQATADWTRPSPTWIRPSSSTHSLRKPTPSVARLL